MSGGTKGVTNMPDLEKFVKNVMYGGIGAAASLVEEFLKVCICIK